MDVNANSVKKARENGLDVMQGAYRDVKGKYDLIFSFAVLEHIPSPSDFFLALKSHLSAKGLLLVAQPCQDKGSNDIFFSDHLWHFFSHHIAEFGERQGFQETLRLIGSDSIPNFSLHLFQLTGHRKRSKRDHRYMQKIDKTIDDWKRIFEDVNKWLDENKDHKLAVWGIGQTFTLLYTYTNLKDSPIAVAFDDNLLRYDQDDLDFPIMKFQSRNRADDHEMRILATFKPAKAMVKHFKELSISYHSPFEGET